MHRYVPTQETVRAKRLAFWLFTLSLIVFGLSAWEGLPFRFAVQLLSVVLLTAAIMLCVRYLFRGYCYMIENHDGSIDFDAYELSRAGSVLVCRFAMSSLRSVTPIAEFQRAKQQRIYNYCIDIKPKNAYILEFDNEVAEGTVLLMIQCEGAFLELLCGNPWKTPECSG